jgi:type IV pilus assembly protein PilM
MLSTWEKLSTRAENLLRKTRDMAGVDVGSRFLKAVMLRSGRSGLQLQGYATGAFDKDPDSYSLSDYEIDRRRIQALQEQLAFPLHAVGISVSGPQVFLKGLTLPVMTENDLRGHLALELDRYIPLDVQDVVWDVSCRQATGVLKHGRQEQYLIVAKKAFVEGRIQQFEQQGIHVRFVDVDPFALVNTVAYNYGQEGTWLIVHLGPTGILLVIVEAGEPVDVRHVSYEGEWYGDLLDRVLLLYETSEEGYKFETSEALLLEQFFKETTDQVIETLKHFSDISETTGVQEILLSGGYSMVKGLPARLSDSLNKPVGLLDPFKRIAVSSAMEQDSRFQKASPLLGVAVGIALRGCGSLGP